MTPNLKLPTTTRQIYSTITLIKFNCKQYTAKGSFRLNSIANTSNVVSLTQKINFYMTHTTWLLATHQQSHLTHFFQ